MSLRRVVPYAVIAVVYAALFFAYRGFMPALERGYDGPSPEARRFADLHFELRQQGVALRDVLIRDSILPLIPREAGVVNMLPDADSWRTEYLRRVAEREAPGALEVSIPIMGVSVGFANFPEIPEALSSLNYYAGERAGGAPYCAVVVPYFKANPQFSTRRGNLLGPCRVWARHGAAGPHIAEWMVVTGGAFARDEWSGFDFEYEGATYARRFGSEFWGSFESRRCRAGDDAACEHAVVGVDSSARMAPRFSMSGTGHFMPRIAPGEGGLLADMEKEFGSERFQRFWKSPEPVEQAFEAAFGVSLGQWVIDWSEARYGRTTIGSRLKLETIFLSLIFMGLFAGLAVATARGRRI